MLYFAAPQHVGIAFFSEGLRPISGAGVGVAPFSLFHPATPLRVQVQCRVNLMSSGIYLQSFTDARVPRTILGGAEGVLLSIHSAAKVHRHRVQNIRPSAPS